MRAFHLPSIHVSGLVKERDRDRDRGKKECGVGLWRCIAAGWGRSRRFWRSLRSLLCVCFLSFFFFFFSIFFFFFTRLAT